MTALSWYLLSWVALAPGPEPSPTDTGSPPVTTTNEAAGGAVVPATEPSAAGEATSPQPAAPQPPQSPQSPQSPATSAPALAPTQPQPAAEPSAQPQPQPAVATPPTTARVARKPAAEQFVVGARQTGIPPQNVARKDRDRPRYLHPPLSTREWKELVPGHLLLNINTGDRVCVYATALTADTLYYLDPKGGEHRISRANITAVHENSWECTSHRTVPLTEWALPGTISGLSLSALSLAMGILYDAGRGPRDNPTYNFLKPYHYAILGLPTGLIGPPLVAFAGRSASRDFRVRGVPGARTTGWVLFGASAIAQGMWLAADFGDVEALQYPGHTVVPALLGMAAASLLAVDALKARKELQAARKRDATPQSTAVLQTMQMQLSPVLQNGKTRGLSFGIGGQF